MTHLNILLILCPPVYPKMPPLGIAYLMEYLNARGMSAQSYDMNNALYRRAAPDTKKAWLVQNNPEFSGYIQTLLADPEHPEVQNVRAIVTQQKPAAIGFSLFRSNRDATFAIAKILAAEFPEIVLIFGGPEVFTLQHEQNMMCAAVFPTAVWVIGAGEHVLGEILTKKKGSYPNVIKAPSISDISSLPFPRFTSFSLTDYDYHDRLPIQFSRGCINRCAFCSERILVPQYATRTPTPVIQELQYHFLKHGISIFVFYDSLINGNIPALETLCDIIITKQLNIHWEAQCCIRNDMSRELVSKMKRAGCFNLFIGLESASAAVLKRMNKGFTLTEARSFFQLLSAEGLHFEISLITNYPGETENEFQETLQFIRDNKSSIPKIAQVNPWVPYVGTTAAQHTHMVDFAQGIRKLERMRAFFEHENIPYTKSYIGNLLPG